MKVPVPGWCPKACGPVPQGHSQQHKDIQVTSIKRKDGLKRRRAFEEEEKEDWRREDERGVPQEAPQNGQPPRETGADSGGNEETEAPRREDTPSEVRISRSNADHVPRGMWLSQCFQRICRTGEEVKTPQLCPIVVCLVPHRFKVSCATEDKRGGSCLLSTLYCLQPAKDKN
ncbi:hypothetical protein NDU88_001120 [Pleurodeles waltl]|uniref:Uncharacterized protein n=1 Tax=Pleurodeles waltl TaxID=8319 RepID=A0AAV7VAS0_PLEWA|nr:hypothetical protein NDU88_001120 [Pleurodeles waltl]